MCIEITLQSPAAKTPAAPGCHVACLLLQQGGEASRQVGIGRKPCERRDGLWPQTRQVGAIEADTHPASLATMSYIMVGNDGIKIDQSTHIESREERDQVHPDQPASRAIQRDPGDDEDQPN